MNKSSTINQECIFDNKCSKCFRILTLNTIKIAKHKNFFFHFLFYSVSRLLRISTAQWILWSRICCLCGQLRNRSHSISKAGTSPYPALLLKLCLIAIFNVNVTWRLLFILKISRRYLLLILFFLFINK